MRSGNDQFLSNFPRHHSPIAQHRAVAHPIATMLPHCTPRQAASRNHTTCHATGRCIDLADGNTYLMSDVNVRCDEEFKATVWPIAAMLMVVHACGVPLLFAFRLYSHREVLHMAGPQYSLGFLYHDYRRDLYWWERPAGALLMSGGGLFTHACVGALACVEVHCNQTTLPHAPSASTCCASLCSVESSR